MHRERKRVSVRIHFNAKSAESQRNQELALAIFLGCVIFTTISLWMTISDDELSSSPGLIATCGISVLLTFSQGWSLMNSWHRQEEVTMHASEWKRAAGHLIVHIPLFSILLLMFVLHFHNIDLGACFSGSCQGAAILKWNPIPLERQDVIAELNTLCSKLTNSSGRSCRVDVLEKMTPQYGFSSLGRWLSLSTLSD